MCSSCKELTFYERVIACLIVIESRTGMRQGELRLLEVGKLDELSIFEDKVSVHYLNFFTYKSQSTKNGRWTEAAAL